ncbi:MAG: hypothetical protein M3373_10155 [Gemmatimonadota bacterium]|nr:hypothetical protein [Gemmatimonadota bacterium]
MRSLRCLAAGTGVLIPVLAAAQQPQQTPASATSQPIDSAYTAKIRELTPTDPKWKFTTELVDHLPASATVPTPLKVIGYVPGTIGKLSYVADINRYFRAVAEASPRARLFTLGESDEGREMILLAIADEATIERLDDYRAMAARLADPRGMTADERARLIREGKPIYWLTGAIHSPETGSPEMLMELAYRLTVDESEHVRAIRENVITLITPVIEVDGRDRMVDVVKLSRELKLGPSGVPLVYWGKYTAHDNNRDGMVVSQKLTQQFLRGFLHWRPTVTHDLHESIPFLYASTGTGPYNDEFDPIVIHEWHQIAYQEINELTKRGLPGVWTHGFYDGWAPNYMLAIANLHNSIGRFYETYTSRNADCHTVQLPASATERRWDRPNPPVNGVRWCIRSNINYQQSGVLVALRYVGDNKETFLENNVAKAERMIRRGQTTAPYAYVIPRGQRRAAEAADLVNLFRTQGAEVHVAIDSFETQAADSAPRTADSARRPADTATATPAAPEPQTADSARRAADTATATPAARNPQPATRSPQPAVFVRPGDWIVRMDQPYTATVRTLLSVQRYKPDDPPPYDDTGWTLDELRHVETIKVADSTVLARPMRLLGEDARVEGAITGTGSRLIVRHLGDWRSAALPWKVAPARLTVADTAFAMSGATYPAGTFIIEGATSATRDAVQALGLNATATSEAVPASVRRHAVTLPRLALLHSWLETQNEGWVRFALDRMGIPYTYISDQSLARPGALDRFDVILFPHVSGTTLSLINGRPKTGPPIPWRKTALTPNLGRGPLGHLDETDDVRRGMGLDGAAALRRFVERGGLLIVTGNTARLPVELGFNPTVSIPQPTGLRARGGIYRAQAVATESPVLYGYERATFPIYFNQAPLFTVQQRDTITSRTDGIDPGILEQTERQRARVVLRFHERADSLLVSGLLVGGNELAGRAAVVDAPVGDGHVLLFGLRPFWRWETQGMFALALNAIANWNHLTPPRPSRAPPVAAGLQ